MEPGREARLAAELRQREPRPDERVLRDLLGVRGRARDPERQPEGPVAVTVDQRAERRGVAGPRPLDQGALGRGVLGCVGWYRRDRVLLDGLDRGVGPRVPASGFKKLPPRPERFLETGRTSERRSKPTRSRKPRASKSPRKERTCTDSASTPAISFPLMIFALPIIAVVGGITAGIVKTIGQQRLLEMAQRERLAAIERGVDPSKLPPMPAAALDNDPSSIYLTPYEHARRRSQGLLIGGIITLAVGIAVGVFAEPDQHRGAEHLGGWVDSGSGRRGAADLLVDRAARATSIEDRLRARVDRPRPRRAHRVVYTRISAPRVRLAGTAT